MAPSAVSPLFPTVGLVRLMGAGLLLATLFGCGGPSYTVNHHTYYLLPSGRNYHRTGEACYYAARFHGRRTASGETLDLNAMTCAHKELPFGTRLKVTNLENGRWVVVRVNDRGPFTKGRLIDLTPAAAKRLNFFAQGRAKVKVDSADDTP